jgi:glycosyltransferase involved in cell wall biosynthesis
MGGRVQSRSDGEAGYGRARMRIAIVYDCLFPNTLGGAERWYRNLAERLDRTHSVTFVTRRQWGEEGPQTPFETIAVSPGGGLYTSSGRRSIRPPIRFGIGVFLHLLRHGRGYDAVHSASFPFFSLLGAALALKLTRSRARLIVDWWELWTLDYWRSYLGSLGGRIGYVIQSFCTRLPDRSFTFSRLVEGRLRERRPGAEVERLTGAYSAESAAVEQSLRPSEPPLVVSAGRHIPEKRVPTVPRAIAIAREQVPGLRCEIFGDGPETEATRGRIRELGLGEAVAMRGRVQSDRVMRSIAVAACLLHPSLREGYGLVIVEAASVGTPSIVVRGPENAAAELIEAGVNGFVAESAEPEELARALIEVVRAGESLRASTLDWYERHREELSIESSLAAVEASYFELRAEPAQARS